MATIAFARAAVGAAILLVSAALLAVLASSGGGLAVGASPSLRGAASVVSSTRLLSERIISSEDLLDDEDDDDSSWPTWAIFTTVFSVGLPLLCCLCGVIACTRIKGHPDEIEEDKIIDATNGDRYGPHLELKQRFQAIELCGFEAKNVYTALPDGRIYIRETSDCFQRNFCSANRELTLWAHGGPSDTAPVFLRMYKPFHLGCCCCCRPSMEVEMTDGTPIGTIEDPFKCCTMDQQLLDANGELRFTVTGSVCQSGICCSCLDSVDFDIEDDLGHVVGHISKEAQNCSEMFKDTNRFSVEFPVDCTMEDKHLLLGSAMLLDLQYFEENKSK